MKSITKKKPLAVFLDIRKAFDVVNHNILLKKLSQIGIGDRCLTFFRDYLSDRSQFTVANDTNSSLRSIVCGVPQGTVLGPILFLIYINELCDLNTEGNTIGFTDLKGEENIISFADDTALVVSGETWNDSYEKAQRCLQTLLTQLDQDLLTLNYKKTVCMPFYINKKNAPPPDLHLKFHESTCDLLDCSACPVVSRQFSTKYLGIFIDENLKWSEHIKYVKTKLSNIMMYSIEPPTCLT